MSGLPDRFLPAAVEARAEFKADETPLAFRYEGRRLAVAEIVDRWYQAGRDPTLPSASYFKVKAEDGWRYVLKRDNESQRWYVMR